jgi:hypothetical protein
MARTIPDRSSLWLNFKKEKVFFPYIDYTEKYPSVLFPEDLGRGVQLKLDISSYIRVISRKLKKTFIAKCLDCNLMGVRLKSTLGRLSFKREAAGKLRVFAMVDIWTQSIFKPLHDSLFEILSGLPNDATFNQGAAFKRAVSKAKESGHCYGYDLSAATDRLPLIIQIKILSGLIGNHLGSL